LKLALGLAMVAIIGVHFAEDLLDRRLWERSLRPAWIVAAGLLYLAGTTFSALTWRRLLILCGYQPRLYTTIRSFFLGQLGRYLPGKAWAMFLRAELVSADGVPAGTGAVTAFYEVFITMTGAVLPAAILFAVYAPGTGYQPHGQILNDLVRLRLPAEVEPGRRASVLLALGLLAFVGTVALPPVFTRLAHRVAGTFGFTNGLPVFGWKQLTEGLLLTCTGWLILGASLAAALFAVVGTAIPWSPVTIGRVIAILGVSYVAGFVIVFAPSGLGVREYFLALFLSALLAERGLPPQDSRALAILTALVLRVAWTGAEIALAVVLWRVAPAPAKPVS
jgi:uncharacterized membrane protein YbhN (UPF0104 family)